MKQGLWRGIALVLVVALMFTMAGCTREKKTPTPQPTQTNVPALPATPAPSETVVRVESPAAPGTGVGASATADPAAALTPTAVPPIAPPVVPTLIPTATPIPPAAEPTAASQPAQGPKHTVSAGETLYSIAARYGTTVSDIRQANDLTSDTIYVGQTLTIPGGSSAPSTSGVTHQVSEGETLYSIALRYGVTVDALKAANGLGSDIIVVGQTLAIPAGGQASPPAEVRHHVVQSADTLLSIALKYGVTVDAIVQANGLPNPNYIYVGQELRIP
ncbi:MAG: LysM peptidoglycan-binding domain-containing protein [Chloroflexi bacterium]|nr:LysM peptidoglycan-binding domain-containing protein [Chloroflexota bacterium]